jgi:hypothetical protein
MHARVCAVAFAMAALSITLAFLPPPAHAQSGPMSIGSVGTVTQINACPSGIFSPPPPATQTVCYQTTVTCPNTYEIGVIFGYVIPTTPNGTSRKPYGTVLRRLALGVYGG